MAKQHSVEGGRWTRNKPTARYLGISDMTLWRWKRDSRLNFPPPSIIRGIEYNDLNLVDAWLRARAVSNIETAA